MILDLSVQWIGASVEVLCSEDVECKLSLRLQTEQCWASDWVEAADGEVIGR